LFPVKYQENPIVSSTSFLHSSRFSFVSKPRGVERWSKIHGKRNIKLLVKKMVMEQAKWWWRSDWA